MIFEGFSGWKFRGGCVSTCGHAFPLHFLVSWRNRGSVRFAKKKWADTLGYLEAFAYLPWATQIYVVRSRETFRMSWTRYYHLWNGKRTSSIICHLPHFFTIHFFYSRDRFHENYVRKQIELCALIARCRFFLRAWKTVRAKNRKFSAIFGVRFYLLITILIIIILINWLEETAD